MPVKPHILLTVVLILFSPHSGVFHPFSSPASGTPALEQLGNPFLAAYPDDAMTYARNIWTMMVFDGRLYLGGGNSGNTTPAANAGPVDVWSYDPNEGFFEREYTVEEEQIDRYAVHDGMLYIPGRDELDGVNTGNIYRLEADGWHKYRTVPDSRHIYDLINHDGRLFTSFDNTLEDNQVVAVSDDDGMTWTPIRADLYLPPDDPALVSQGWSLFKIGSELFLNAFSTTSGIMHQDGTIEMFRELPTVFRYDGEVFQALETNFYPGAPTGFLRRVPRSVMFDGQTIYIGAETQRDFQWLSFGLYAVDESLQVRRFLEDNSVRYWDVLAEGDRLYVLTSQSTSDGAEMVAVKGTSDLETWETITTFTAGTYARSFAVLDGMFYFGLGCDSDAPLPACGEILRVAMAD